MNRIVLGQSLRSQLNGLSGQLEFVDESGHSLGFFLPADEYRELMKARSTEHTSPEEVQRLRAEHRGRTLAEIWKRVGQE